MHRAHSAQSNDRPGNEMHEKRISGMTEIFLSKSVLVRLAKVGAAGRLSSGLNIQSARCHGFSSNRREVNPPIRAAQDGAESGEKSGKSRSANEGQCEVCSQFCVSRRRRPAEC